MIGCVNQPVLDINCRCLISACRVVDCILMLFCIFRFSEAKIKTGEDPMIIGFEVGVTAVQTFALLLYVVLGLAGQASYCEGEQC